MNQVKNFDIDQINPNLLTLTYGSLIVRLIKDYEKPEEINEQLEKMGYNIGIRLIDDFLAKKSFKALPSTFKDSIDIVKSAFYYYMGINAEYKMISAKEFSILFTDNPLNDDVELPDKYDSLWYSNIYCGVIKGAFEAINIKVDCIYTKDTLKKNNETNEIKIKFVEIIEEKLAEEEI